jgi:2-amino-4-hydroxy-6-hydroxymethyldihydropteridine diphosphokinase
MKTRVLSLESSSSSGETLPPGAVLIGMGGNLGDPVAQCREAVRGLEEHPDVTVLRCSSLYRTEPLGKHDQNWFVNGVVLCETTLGPERLLFVLQQMEKRCGRVRRERWGPRTLDLDLLSFGEVVLETESLTLPHPRLHERRFVLVPLLEVAPNWRHPVLLRTARELLEALDVEQGQSVEPLVL